MGDQHRWDCIGAHGNPEIKTEYLDALVADGVTYQNAFCTAPVCTPSRYAMLTSLHPHQHLGYTNESSIPFADLTFPQKLKDHGYFTEMIGKMHTNPTRLDVGYEKSTYAEQTEPGRYQDDYHDYLAAKGMVDLIDEYDQVESRREEAPEEYWRTFGAMPSTLDEKDYSTTWIGDRAIKSLEKWEGEGNLLTVSFINPHHPFDPPYPWCEMYDPDEMTILPGWTDEVLERNEQFHPGYFPNKKLNPKALKKVTSYYYAMISQIDHYIGKFIDLLKSKGMYDDTIVIYTSDHGEYLGFQHMLLKSNHMYDPIVRVPLIVKYPKSLAIQTDPASLVYNIDIGPTLYDLLDISPLAFASGKSLLSDGTARKFVVTEDGRGEAYMIRSDRYKLLLNPVEERSLFFDLKSDPYELNNLYHEADYQDLIQEFQLKIGRFMLFDQPTPIYKDYYQGQ